MSGGDPRVTFGQFRAKAKELGCVEGEPETATLPGLPSTTYVAIKRQIGDVLVVYPLRANWDEEYISWNVLRGAMVTLDIPISEFGTTTAQYVIKFGS